MYSVFTKKKKKQKTTTKKKHPEGEESHCFCPMDPLGLMEEQF